MGSDGSSAAVVDFIFRKHRLRFGLCKHVFFSTVLIEKLSREHYEEAVWLLKRRLSSRGHDPSTSYLFKSYSLLTFAESSIQEDDWSQLQLKFKTLVSDIQAIQMRQMLYSLGIFQIHKNIRGLGSRFLGNINAHEIFFQDYMDKFLQDKSSGLQLSLRALELEMQRRKFDAFRLHFESVFGGDIVELIWSSIQEKVDCYPFGFFQDTTWV